MVIGFCFYVDMLQENFKNIIKNNKIIGFLIYDGISHIRQINIYQIKSDQREGISLPLFKQNHYCTHLLMPSMFYPSIGECRSIAIAEVVCIFAK